MTGSFLYALSVLWLYHLIFSTNLNFCHIFKGAILAILLCLYLYSFWASFLHSSSKLMMDSSLSPSHSTFFGYLLAISVLSYSVFSEYLFLCCKHQDFHFLLQITFRDSSNVFSLLSFISFTSFQWNCFSFHCLCLCLLFI